MLQRVKKGFHLPDPADGFFYTIPVHNISDQNRYGTH
jgi:hypothetical protein